MNRTDIFLDTTYLMPFFNIDIDVDGFSKDVLRNRLSGFDSIHVSEISIIEVKAKILKIGSQKINNTFRKNLKILRNDEKFTFHGYTANDDLIFEKLKINLNFIDRIIVAQALSAGLLLTEDRMILKSADLLKDSGLGVVNWKMFVKRF